MSQLKRFFLILVAVAFTLSFTGYTANAADPEKGKKLFQNNCSSCHQLGSRLVGPDLVGINERRDQEWLHKFIPNSQALINAGDPIANQVFEEFNKIPMPPQSLTEDEVNDVLAYIDQAGKEIGQEPEPPIIQEPPKEPITEDSLFQILVGLIALLLIAILLVALNILNLVGKLRGGPETEITEAKGAINWEKLNPYLFIGFLVFGIIAMIWETGIHYQWVLPGASSEHGEKLDTLFDVTMVITLFVFLVTQVLLFFFAFKYRQARKSKETKAFWYPENNKLELFWTLVPAVVLITLVLYGFRNWQQIMSPSENHTVEVEVFAYQFGWQTRYPGPDGKLGKHDFRLITQNNPLGLDYDDPDAKDDIIVQGEMALPNNQDVLLRIRSKDVLHAVWLPHFRVQMYAVPGMPTQFKFKPIKTTEQMREELENPDFNYELACNQLCGVNHFGMRMFLNIFESAEYDNWLSNQKPYYERYQELQKKQSASSN